MRTARNNHMEQVYANVERGKHAELELQKTPRKSKRSFVSVFLGLLSFFLLAGLVALAVFYGRLVRHSCNVCTNLTLTEDLTAERDSLISNLTHHLQTSRDQLSAVTEERDSLRANLTEQSRQLERLRPASRLRRNCADRWTRFSGNCYLLSTQSLSWQKAREFCIREGADLVTIDNAEEQKFVSEWITKETWIGLNDREEEGTWRWAMDNSPLIQGFWSENRPNNGNSNTAHHQEDCVHFQMTTKRWNDQRCDDSKNFICEK